MNIDMPTECPVCKGKVEEYDDEIDTFDKYCEGRGFHLFCTNKDCEMYEKDVYEVSYTSIIDEVIDLVEVLRKAKKEQTCCVREDCEWMDGKGDNDHQCIGFVQNAIIAQIEELPHEQKTFALKNALLIHLK